MSLDFTFDKYLELCETIVQSPYVPLTLRQFLTLSQKPERFIILRHDVDMKPERSLHIARIESRFGIKSTYYFRVTRGVFKKAIIQEIAKMGHEIGYHYEVMDKTKGDYPKAVDLFQKELKTLREITDISTICMHGKSWTRQDNRDLWKRYDMHQFGILGEAYLSIDFKEVSYLSDSSRSWSNRYKLKDTHSDLIVRDTDDIMRLIHSGLPKRVYILVHPDEWSSNYYEWLFDLIIQSIINLGKIGIKLSRNLQRIF